jgi:RNA polymerase sigma factor (sigma-70 family)
MIRVLLVDDHAAFRQALAFMLAREPDITVVGQAGSVEQARSAVKDADVALVDLDLGGESGIDLLRYLRMAAPSTRCLVLSGTNARRELAEAVRAGAEGLIHKSGDVEEIIGAVRRTADGQPLLSTSDVRSLVDGLAQEDQERDRERSALQRLTGREHDVLRALAAGLSDKEIAEQLGISSDTVRTHMVNLLRKLRAESRLQAVVLAFRHGIIEL